MTRNDIIMTLKILKTAYPKFYSEMTKIEMENTLNLWCDMFEYEDTQIVTLAIKNLINHFKWPPTIADIKEEIYKIETINDESPVELWNSIKKALRNSIYNSTEEFEKLPELAKKFVGNPKQLREWALDTDYNDSVVKGQFLKQIEILKTRKKDKQMLVPEVKEMINTILAKSNEIKKITG